MSSEQEQQAANMLGPKMGGISVMAVSGTSARLNLAAATQLGSKVEHGRFVTAAAEGADVWFFLNNADAGTADETATSGNDRCYFIPDGGSRDFICPDGYNWVVAKASASGYLRMFLSSRPPHEAT